MEIKFKNGDRVKVVGKKWFGTEKHPRGECGEIIKSPIKGKNTGNWHKWGVLLDSGMLIACDDNDLELADPIAAALARGEFRYKSSRLADGGIIIRAILNSCTVEIIDGCKMTSSIWRLTREGFIHRYPCIANGAALDALLRSGSLVLVDDEPKPAKQAVEQLLENLHQAKAAEQVANEKLSRIRTEQTQAENTAAALKRAGDVARDEWNKAKDAMYEAEQALIKAA